MGDLDNKKRIAVFSIFTGNYIIFYKQFIKSIQQNFLPDCEKHFFICSDQKLEEYKCIRKKLTSYKIDDLEFPYITLLRYKIFNETISKDLSSYDYVFFLNSNARCLAKITMEDIDLDKDYTFTLHDNHLDGGINNKPFEQNKLSTACFSEKWESPEYIGGRFFGAKTEKFKTMCVQLADNTEKDLEHDIIAEWHDESHLNWFFNTFRKDISYNLMSVNYHVQEQHSDREIFSEQKIIYIDKNKKAYKNIIFRKRLSSKPDALNLAILVWKFPTQANTYIVAEMMELIKYEKNFIIYSIDEPSDTTKDMFKHELKILKDKIVYISKENLLSFPRGFSKKVAIGDNRKRRSFSKYSKNSNLINAEEESIKQSSIIISKLADHMKSHNVKHIYSPFGNGSCEYALFINALTKIPYSFAVHAYDLFVNYYYKNAKSKTVSNVFSITEYNKKYLEEKCYMPSEKIKIKRINFLEHDYDSVEGFCSEHPYIFSAGRLEEMKGFEYSIRGFHNCLLKYPDLKYYIAGRAIQGEYDTKVENLIKELNLENKVILLGAVENKVVFSYAKNAIFSVLTSVHESNGDTEGMPTFFAESMQMGTPCVGSDISGIPELITSGVTGELVIEKDQNSINEKMCKMIDLFYNDRDSYESMRTQCKISVSEIYDNEKNIKILIDAIKETKKN